MLAVKSEIILNEQLAPDRYLLKIRAPRIAETAQPGQFVNLKLSNDYRFLLPRPFSISRVKGGVIELLFKVVGSGTQVLSNYRAGQFLEILGPFGKGFRLSEASKRALLVAGGIGLASLRFLSYELDKRGTAQLLLYGEESQRFWLPLEKLLPESCSRWLVAEDSFERHGLVTDFLQSALDKFKPQIVYSCGPIEMLCKVASFVQQSGLKAEVALEEKMACGFGACWGCVCYTTEGYKRICQDGPVFQVEEIEWKSYLK